jgi:polysaccharide deacetylase 2 family uncharacterized protein YibQ
MTNELSTPLTGRKRKAVNGKLQRKPLPVGRISVALLAVVVVGLVTRLVLVDDPDGGRPVSELSITSAPGGNPLVSDMLREPATIIAEPEQPIPAGASVTTVDPNLPSEIDDGAMPAVNEMGAQLDLVEETQDGAIPRIGGNGQTAFAAYARPSVSPATAGGRPLIAILVTGLGLNETGTMDAIEQLPGAVTLAFAPYGKSLVRTTEAARQDGHELLLEIPLEPFDYPQNDPGPETLLTGEAPRANLDKLFWLMARMGGYVGVINNMGARFTSSAADFSPVMEELGARGLGYVDDGSSNRSLAPQLAAGNKVPFTRAQVVLDQNPARAPILEALAELEAEAVRTGSAVGLVSALPVSIQTIAEWANDVEDRGIVLVPASALMR